MAAQHKRIVWWLRLEVVADVVQGDAEVLRELDELSVAQKVVARPSDILPFSRPTNPRA